MMRRTPGGRPSYGSEVGVAARAVGAEVAGGMRIGGAASAAQAERASRAVGAHGV